MALIERDGSRGSVSVKALVAFRKTFRMNKNDSDRNIFMLDALWRQSGFQMDCLLSSKTYIVVMWPGKPPDQWTD